MLKLIVCKGHQCEYSTEVHHGDHIDILRHHLKTTEYEIFRSSEFRASNGRDILIYDITNRSPHIKTIIIEDTPNTNRITIPILSGTNKLIVSLSIDLRLHLISMSY